MISKPSEVDGTPHFTEEAAELVRCLMLYREVTQLVYGSPETDLGSFDLKAAWLLQHPAEVTQVCISIIKLIGGSVL